jgi:hypothetical protein
MNVSPTWFDASGSRRKLRPDPLISLMIGKVPAALRVMPQTRSSDESIRQLPSGALSTKHDSLFMTGRWLFGSVIIPAKERTSGKILNTSVLHGSAPGSGHTAVTRPFPDHYCSLNSGGVNVAGIRQSAKNIATRAVLQPPIRLPPGQAHANNFRYPRPAFIVVLHDAPHDGSETAVCETPTAHDQWESPRRRSTFRRLIHGRIDGRFREDPAMLRHCPTSLPP